jgi:hypothetical protein
MKALQTPTPRKPMFVVDDPFADITKQLKKEESLKKQKSLDKGITKSEAPDFKAMVSKKSEARLLKKNAVRDKLEKEIQEQIKLKMQKLMLGKGKLPIKKKEDGAPAQPMGGGLAALMNMKK